MRQHRDDEYHMPIIDCPCGERDVPLATEGPWVKVIDAERIELYISYCPFCERVPEDESEIKGYASDAELLAMGWYKEEECE